MGSLLRSAPVAAFAVGLALGLGLTPAVAAAQAPAHCQPGQAAEYVFGFADLAAQLGDMMGSPASCEYADPNGSGDTLQDTTSGLAFWRKSTNTPTFTDGATHWGLTPGGLVAWSGPSIDPPAGAIAPVSPAPPATPPVPPAPLLVPPSPAPPSPSAAAGTCGAPNNPWGYSFCPGGSRITAPPATFCSVFRCIPSFGNQTNGYVVECRDGLFSHSGGVRGSCSSHGGNNRTLYSH